MGRNRSGALWHLRLAMRWGFHRIYERGVSSRLVGIKLLLPIDELSITNAPAMTTNPYRVELDVFSGPLDLLLYLVRRNEVSIVELPIAEITRRFEQYLKVLKFIDLDLVGDFVVMASTLVEIKSRMVLPRQEEDETEPEITEDPRSDLIKQLLEYKKFKDAARSLEEQATEWQERFPRLEDDRPLQGKDPSADRIKEVELWDLVSALARVVEKKVIEEEASICYDETPIAIYIEQVAKRVRAEKRVAFTSLFEKTTLKSKIVGIFLAILELLRRQHFRAEQEEDFSEIWIMSPDDTANDDSDRTAQETDPDV